MSWLTADGFTGSLTSGGVSWALAAVARERKKAVPARRDTLVFLDLMRFLRIPGGTWWSKARVGGLFLERQGRSGTGAKFPLPSPGAQEHLSAIPGRLRTVSSSSD
jgi:hypothetical protein